MITSATEQSKTMDIIQDYLNRFPLYNTREPKIKYIASGPDDFKVAEIVKELNTEPLKFPVYIYGIVSNAERPIFRINSTYARFTPKLVEFATPYHQKYFALTQSSSDKVEVRDGAADKLELGISYNLRKEALPALITFLKELLCVE